MIIADCICADDSNENFKGKVALFSQSDDELYPLDDKRSTRSMNRMIILILNCLNRKIRELNFVENKRIGIYALCDVGPTPSKIFDILIRGDEKLYDAFKVAWPPKQLFKKDGGVISAQISIFLKSHGPAFSYNNSDECFRQALRAAQCDLDTNWIDYALIAGGFSPEDPTLLYKAQINSDVVSEGAGFLLFDKAESDIEIPSDYKKYYSHCSEMIGAIRTLKSKRNDI